MAPAGRSTSTSATPKSAEVDAYITGAPKAAQPHLRALRRMIRESAPQAEERISYGMPYYDYHGRLVYFAAHSSHVGLYALGETHKAEGLQRYVTGKGTLQFRFDEPLPVPEIKRLLEKRVRENEMKPKKPAAARPRASARSASRGGASGSPHASR